MPVCVYIYYHMYSTAFVCIIFLEQNLFSEIINFILKIVLVTHMPLIISVIFSDSSWLPVVNPMLTYILLKVFSVYFYCSLTMVMIAWAAISCTILREIVFMEVWAGLCVMCYQLTLELWWPWWPPKWPMFNSLAQILQNEGSGFLNWGNLSHVRSSSFPALSFS